MKISMGVALPLFCESTTELVDIELLENVSSEFVKSELQKVLPEESEVLKVEQIEKSVPSIDQTACWAEYKIKIFTPQVSPTRDDSPLYDFDNLVYNTEKV